MELCYFMPITPKEKAVELRVNYQEQLALIAAADISIIRDTVELVAQIGAVVDSQP